MEKLFSCATGTRGFYLRTPFWIIFAQNAIIAVIFKSFNPIVVFMIDKYFRAYLWLGAISVLLSLLLVLAAAFNHFHEEITSLKISDFLRNMAVFVPAYSLGAIWLWYAKPVWENKKLKFSRLLWKTSYVFLALYWICRICVEFTPNELLGFGGGWTVYPPLNANPMESPFLSGLLSKTFFEMLGIGFVLLAMLCNCLNLLIVIYTKRKSTVSVKHKIINVLLSVLSVPVVLASVLLVVGRVFLFSDRMFGSSFFLSDIYIAGAEPPTESVRDTMVSHTIQNTPYTLPFTFCLWLLCSSKPRSVIGICFVIFSVAATVLMLFLSKRFSTIEVQLHDTYYVLNSTNQSWHYFLFFGFIAVLYQLAVLNRQSLSHRMGFAHMFLFVCGFALFFMAQHGAWQHRYMESENQDAFAQMTEFHGRLLVTGVLLMAVGQAIFVVGYFLNRRRKSISPAT
ncbi:MAG: hypothetical protein MUD08_19190 [Cytophagales bacterium]|nr:hypothetical protein [Cytophagales bacterium]